jgi:hypothetical protein
MSDEEHADAPEDTESDDQSGGQRSRDEELAENAGDAFRDLYEPGPRVHTSSRPLDEGTSTESIDRSGSEETGSSSSAEESGGAPGDTTRTVVSDRSMDETLDDAHADEGSVSPSADSSDPKTRGKSQSEDTSSAAAPPSVENNPAEADHGEPGHDESQTTGTADERSTTPSAGDGGEIETDGSVSDTPTDVDADHTRSLDGDTADTTPVSDLDLSMDDLDGSASSTDLPDPESTEDDDTDAFDQSDGLLARLKTLLFGW